MGVFFRLHGAERKRRKQKVMKTENRVYSGTLDCRTTERELAHAKLVRRAAAEGIVLLKNEGLLPLKESTPIALFGSGAAETVKGGTGSGDVNSRESISIYRGMREEQAVITSEAWLKDYEKCYETARNAWRDKVLADAKRLENPFDAYAANPFSLPEGREIRAEDLKDAAVAVYVISRISGEGKDRRRQEGDYYLSRKEQEDIRLLDRAGLPLVLMINAGGPVELTDILKEAKNIRAVLNISQPGQEGGRAVSDVLFGKAVPGGRLTMTWARRYEDYPCAETYGYLNGNLETEEYREGIYVGYRYFDSFGTAPLFPFGYGLSYTDFAMRFEGLQITENDIKIAVSVENAGERHCGREVVQVYVTPPQTGIKKEYHRLAGFAKTDSLQPKEMQKLIIDIEQKQLASFSEELSAWVIEKGEYGVWIGNSSASLTLAAILKVRQQTVIEEVEKLWQKTCLSVDEMSSGGITDRAKEEPTETAERRVPVFVFAPKREPNRIGKTPYAAEQAIDELIPLLYGNIAENTSVLGSAGSRVPGSAGETSRALLETYGKRPLVMADGPAGLRLQQSYEVDKKTGEVYGRSVFGALENGFLEPMERHENTEIYYQYCTAFPVGTALAQTWDVKLMREIGEAVAVEMREFHIDLWLAPGMNIHRNPLCGRNFEYYSEDPLLSGMLAAFITAGVQEKGGCGVTIKHFACNNQEDHRMGVDARIGERAFREIYARGFEIAVKRCAPAAMMSAYNRINGVYAANSRELCTTLARKEWGYEGVIMSDWGTTLPSDGSVSWRCAAAGNDIIMPGHPKDDENIRKAYEKGLLKEEEIRTCAGRTLALIDRLDGISR